MTSSSSLSSKNSIVHVVEQHDELDHLINPPVLSATKQQQQQQQQQREASSAITRSTNTNDSCCSSSATTFMTSDDSTDGIISWDDIIIEKFLGIGGSNCVSLARIPKWDSIDNNNNKENVSHGHHQQQQQQQKKKKKYAIKCLNKSVTIAATSSAISDKKKQKKYQRGLNDLMTEGKLLSKLQHPNIIKYYGCTHSSDSKQPYFLVLECLQSITLDDLIHVEWKTKQDAIKVPSTSQRLYTIGLGIAKAMEYLHSQGIIYRDLKPKNIGFDLMNNGTVKLFDFGISKQLTSPSNADGASTGVQGEYVGSLRYMSPETLLNGQSSYQSDIYSFGILLWELITLQKPYEYIQSQHSIELHTMKQFQQHVAINGIRPGIKLIPSSKHDDEVPKSIRRWIQHSWEFTPSRRPSFGQLIRLLETKVCKRYEEEQQQQQKQEQQQATGSGGGSSRKDSILQKSEETKTSPSLGVLRGKVVENWFKRKNVLGGRRRRKVASSATH